MTTDERLLAAAKTLARQDTIIYTLIEVMRPFAAVAEAQKHTDCGGMLKQSEWETVAQMVEAANLDRAILARQASHAH